MSRSIHTITIPSATRYLEDVRRFVAKHANGASFPAKTVHALQLAVDECCANVIEHAYGGDESNTIDIDVVVKGDRLTVRIRDEGQPFVDSKYSEPDIFEYASRKKSGGFGVHLMRKLADQVEYSTRGRSNVCALTMYRDKNEIDGEVRSGKKKAGASRKSARASGVKATTKKTAKKAAKKAAGKKLAKPKRKASTKKTKKSPTKRSASTKKAGTNKRSGTAKKAATKKTATKKTATKKTATKKAATKKAATEKGAAKKSSAKASASKKKGPAKKTSASIKSRAAKKAGTAGKARNSNA